LFFYEVFNLKRIPACGARVTLWMIYVSEIREYKFACSTSVEKKLVCIYSGFRFWLCLFLSRDIWISLQSFSVAIADW